MQIRQAVYEDLEQLLLLYTHLHNNPVPDYNNKLKELWQEILQDKNHYILVAEEEASIIASCVIVIIPNLTHNQQPYSVVENVVTHPNYRNRGFASKLLDAAKNIATEHQCYKIMLMTGSKQNSTLRFYERAGYNRTDKTAFIQWL